MESFADPNFIKLFHNNLVGMVLTNEQHIITEINEHVLKLTGLTREEAVGKTALECGLLQEDNIKTMWQLLDEKGQLVNVELSLINKNNRQVIILISSEKIEFNKAVHWLTTIIDITQRKKTENELAEVYERVTDGFIAIDHNWCYTYINKQAGIMIGKDPGRLVGKHIWTGSPQAKNNPFYKSYHRAMDKQEMITAEEYVPENGRWFQHIIYPSVDGISVFLRDITSRKQKEQQVAGSELRFRTLTKTAPVGIFETDTAGLTTYVNETWMLYSGMSFDEAMGDGWLQAVHPDDREWLVKGWHSKAKKRVESNSEYRIIDKQGKLRWVSGKAVPIINNEGQITGYIGVILDVTESKEADALIKNSEHTKRLILNSAMDAIIIINASSVISFWNPQAEKIFGWTEQEVTGKNLEETIIPPEFKKAHQFGMQHYLQYKEATILNRLIEMQALNKSGARFPVELSILPVEQENEISFCAFIRDITERKDAEITLKERNEQLQELSRHLQLARESERSNIAREIHDELGQQLTGLKMDIMWLKKKVVDKDDAVTAKFCDAISLIDDTVKSIRRIVTELRPSIIDDLGLNAALEWQVHDFAGRMHMKIEYENSFDDENIDPFISIGLFRILQESLTNIAKHAQAKKIMVSIHQLDHAVQLLVKDDGIGFDKEQQEKELSFGLLGIKERTDMMQGKCIITSKPGEGTRIAVTIPLD